MPKYKLLIDVGNSNISIALADEREIIKTIRIATRRGITSDEFMTHFLCHFYKRERKYISHALVASVVPEVERELGRFLERAKIDTTLVDYTMVPLKTKYKRPEELGIDRLLVAFAAKEILGYPVIAVDMGTATTFNCVGKDGTFLGGLIVPGLSTSLESLGKRGARLPIIRDLRTYPPILADNTMDAMKAGILFGYSALVKGLVERLVEELGQAKVVLTGGLAGLILELIGVKLFFEPCLLIQGLRILSQCLHL